ncbi:MAG TPA: hypothetical protein VN201_09980 [Roseateles sp.]|nr:hypothetical protein [Roseateles sp.]
MSQIKPARAGAMPASGLADTLGKLMLRLRSHRLITAFFVVLSLLFSQLALAQYVCPRAADVESMAAMMNSGTPCEGMDRQQPVLCHQHSADLAKNFEAVKLPAAALPAVVQVLELPLVLEAKVGRACTTTATSEAPPPDPLFLSTLRLRV